MKGQQQMKMIKQGEGRAIFIGALVVLCVITLATTHPQKPSTPDKPPTTAVAIPTPVPQYPKAIVVNSTQTKVEYERRVLAEQRAKDHAAGSWVYSTSEDEMGPGTVKLGWVASINRVNLDFPYEGEQYAYLQLRNSPKFGKDIMFGVRRGQFGSTYERNYVTVKFDDGPLQKFVITEAANGTSGLLFIGDQTRFVPVTEKQNISRSKCFSFAKASMYSSSTFTV
jgi:hypothetical protein